MFVNFSSKNCEKQFLLEKLLFIEIIVTKIIFVGWYPESWHAISMRINKRFD